MPGNRPKSPRSVGGVLLIALLLAGFLIPAVSAETVFNETFEVHTSDTFQCYHDDDGGSGHDASMNTLVISTALADLNPSYIMQQGRVASSMNEHIIPISPNWYNAAKDSGHWPVTFTNTDGAVIGSGTFGYFKYNVGGPLGEKWLESYLEIDELDASQITASRGVKFSSAPTGYSYPKYLTHNLVTGPATKMVSENTGLWGIFLQHISGSTYYCRQYRSSKYYPFVSVDWENSVTVNELSTQIPNTEILISRNPDAGDPYTSSVYIDTATSNYNDLLGTDDLEYWVLQENYPINISVLEPGTATWFNRTISLSGTPGTPDPTTNGTVTVYVQNSQTGALLADASLSILAATGGTETEVVNATLPGGTGTYTLQPTGGGLPNPDYYRAVATVPGFSQIIENHSFTLSGPHDVIIEMRPDSGGPADPERAYLEFYVRDYSANPIPSASVQCGNRIKTTNSAGYAIFEVDKNASHSWIAKKSGYTTIEGTATVGPNPRYIVNVVLGPKEIPTNPPATDPGGPGATPTPDRRTNEEKGQAVIDMIADNAEGIGALALICLLMGLLKLMVKW